MKKVKSIKKLDMPLADYGLTVREADVAKACITEIFLIKKLLNSSLLLRVL